MNIFLGSSSIGIRAHRLSNSIDYRNESTNENQTSTTSSSSSSYEQYHSISSRNLVTFTSTIRSYSTFQSFITKPNSYLYDSNDEEIHLERMKRDSPAFVCKSNIYLSIEVDVHSRVFS